MGLPINLKGGAVVALGRLFLPTAAAGAYWPQQVDLILIAAGDEVAGIHIARIDQVCLGKQIFLGEG